MQLIHKEGQIKADSEGRSGKDTLRAKKSTTDDLSLFLSIGHPEVNTENQLPEREIVPLLFRTMVTESHKDKRRISRESHHNPRLISLLRIQFGVRTHSHKGSRIFSFSLQWPQLSMIVLNVFYLGEQQKRQACRDTSKIRISQFRRRHRSTIPVFQGSDTIYVEA